MTEPISYMEKALELFAHTAHVCGISEINGEFLLVPAACVQYDVA